MTDTELFEIVKGHREAWPERAVMMLRKDDNQVGDETMLMFEAAFHRELLKLGIVTTYITPKMGTHMVTVKDSTFEGATLIEAYAMAMEWHK